MLKKTPMLAMFARSPIHPIQEHMQAATQCVQLLPTFVHDALAGDWKAAEAQQIKIAELERDADKLKRDLRLHLPDGLFMAISRSDILSLLVVQDKMANRAKDVAGLIFGRRMTLPASMSQAFEAYVITVVETALQAQRAINELDALMEEGFRGQEVSMVLKMIHRLDDMEGETDDQQVALRNQLFALERDLAPVDVMFLYQAIQLLGGVADRAQDVGGRLQLILAR